MIEDDRTAGESRLRTLVTRVLWPREVTLESYIRYRPYYWVLAALTSVLAAVFIYQWLGWWSLLSLVAVPLIYLVLEVLALNPPWLPACRVKSSAALLGALTVFFMTDARVSSTEYYKFTGGVVPVLLLALILERRQEYWSTDSFGERFLTFINVIGLVIGGATVLRVLADDNTAKGDARLVIAPIVFSLISLLLALVAKPESVAAQRAT